MSNWMGTKYVIYFYWYVNTNGVYSGNSESIEITFLFRIFRLRYETQQDTYNLYM